MKCKKVGDIEKHLDISYPFRRMDTIPAPQQFDALSCLLDPSHENETERRPYFRKPPENPTPP